MTLLERIRNYVKHKFSSQEFKDYKTKDNMIVTGDLEMGKELLDLESMTPIDGELIIDDKKVVVEKGIVKSIEDYKDEEEMEVTEEPVKEVEEVVEDEVKEEESMEVEVSIEPEMEPEMEDEIDEDKIMIDELKSLVESLKNEIEVLKGEKEEMLKKVEELSNAPVQEVFKAVEPIKMKTNSKESLLKSLKDIKSSLE